MGRKPNFSTSSAEQEIDKLEKQFDEFKENIDDLTMDRMNLVPKLEQETQTKLSQAEIERQNGIYLKPVKMIGSREKFNEKFRKMYEYDKEFVNFIAENKEIIGEEIDMWTKPYPGCPAEEWKIPVNKPVWAPRYVAEQLKRKFYHRLEMKEQISHSEGPGQFYGRMVIDTTVPRLDAYPVSNRKSVFMGAGNF